MKSGHLILFDFDGTLTNRDTLFEFCRFHAGGLKFACGVLILLPVLIGQRIRLVSAHRAKEIFLNYFLGGLASQELEELCNRFVPHVSLLIRSKALSAIEEYRKQNVKMIIVSASPENWISPWAKQYGIEVIGTRLQIVDDNVTGRILGKNCNGEEKVNRIRKALNLSDYQKVSAYGDSNGDIPMLNLAHHKFFRPFRDNS